METRSDVNPTTGPSHRRLVANWLAIGALLLLMLAAWAVAIPLMASPDEPSHVVKAAAVARGQWGGVLGPAPTDTSRPGAGTIVQLPSDFAEVISLPDCFAFHPDVSAGCQQAVAPAVGGLVPVETFAGQYPPLYYLLVGWPSLVLGAEASIYGMRLVSAVLTAVLLTWGAFRLSQLPRRHPLTWGIAVAVTPMCLFLGATVNPQGLEIAAAFSFWAACLHLVASREAPSTAALVQAAVSGALLVNVRASSPLWALTVIVVALVLAPAGRWRAVVRHPAARWVGASAVAASVTAIAWVALHGTVVSGSGLYPRYADLRRTVFDVAASSNDYLLNMIGNFGWLDAPVPPETSIAWYLVGGSLLLLGFAVWATARQKAALALLALAVIGAPFVLQLPTAASVGLVWQGRYALPIAIGLPLVAAVLISQASSDVEELVRRMVRAGVPILVVGHVAAFWSASRRYSEGRGGDLTTLAPHWSSPIGYLTGVGLYALVTCCLGYLIWHASRAAPAPTQASALPAAG